MSGWNRPVDLYTRISTLERKDRNKTRYDSAYDPGDRPGAISDVVMDFRLREKKITLHYVPVVTWDPIPPGACAADIAYYVVEIRPTTQGGAEKMAGRRYREQYQVNNAADIEVDNLTTTFQPVEHPKTWWWQARVAAVDKANQKGQWSAWTTPKLPTRAALPRPPAPSFVTLEFDRLDKSRHNPFRAVIIFDEVGPWDIPPTSDKEEEEDREDDISRYKVAIRRCDSAGNFTFGPGRAKNVEAKDQDTDSINGAVFHHVRPKAFYRARVRSIDRFNRRGLWSEWSPVGTAADTTRPPVPTVPAGFDDAGNRGCHVDVDSNTVYVDWAAELDPDDTNTDLRAITDDIAYFQIQLSRDANFANVFKSDRYLTGTDKRFHVTKNDGRFYARVRSVDGSGNVSFWAEGTGQLNYPPTPKNGVNLSFRRQSIQFGSGSYDVGTATWSYNPGGDEAGYPDDRIDHYSLQIMESRNSFFNADFDDSWRISVGDPKGDGGGSDTLRETFNRVNNGNYYRARFKAVDSQGLASNWGPWGATRHVQLG